MNKKIKIIELLLKIAHGEEVPNKIKILGIVFVWFEGSYRKENANLEYISDYCRLDCMLNDEIEILEDNTEEIEELKRTENVYDITLECYHDIEKKISNDELADKINEIIRYIKRKDKNND